MKKITLFTIAITCFTYSLNAQEKTKENDLPSAILTEWMDLQTQLVRSVTGIPHVAYSRHFYYTAIASYESIVHGDKEYRSLGGQLNGLSQLPAHPKGELYCPASLNAVYAAMLHYFYSSFGAADKRIDSMEQGLDQQLQLKYSDKKIFEKSRLYGRQIAAAVIEWSKEDEPNKIKSYTQPKGEGIWVPTPPSYTPASTPFWSSNRSLTKDITDELAILKQPVYAADTGSDFYKMAQEVYQVSRQLTPEQKATAFYWDDSPDGRYKTVFGHWTSLLSCLIKQHEVSLIKATEAFAKMTMSMYEATLLAWEGKYRYNVVRPVTYIQQHIGKQWTPVIITPPHPEFPAAHATLSNAAATALSSLFGETCAVTDKSYIDIGMPERSYSSLQDIAKEAGMSRLYGGIHYRYSIEQGLVLGAQAAKHLAANVNFYSAKKMAVR